VVQPLLLTVALLDEVALEPLGPLELEVVPLVVEPLELELVDAVELVDAATEEVVEA
jgi:hypothetical protein